MLYFLHFLSATTASLWEDEVFTKISKPSYRTGCQQEVFFGVHFLSSSLNFTITIYHAFNFNFVPGAKHVGHPWGKLLMCPSMISIQSHPLQDKAEADINRRDYRHSQTSPTVQCYGPQQRHQRVFLLRLEMFGSLFNHLVHQTELLQPSCPKRVDSPSFHPLSPVLRRCGLPLTVNIDRYWQVDGICAWHHWPVEFVNEVHAIH